MSHASTPTEIARFVSTRLHASKKGKLQQLEACAQPKELSKVGDATILVGCPSGKGKRWARRRFLPARRSLRPVRLSARRLRLPHLLRAGAVPVASLWGAAAGMGAGPVGGRDRETQSQDRRESRDDREIEWFQNPNSKLIRSSPVI